MDLTSIVETGLSGKATNCINHALGKISNASPEKIAAGIAGISSIKIAPAVEAGFAQEVAAGKAISNAAPTTNALTTNGQSQKTSTGTSTTGTQSIPSYTTEKV